MSLFGKSKADEARDQLKKLEKRFDVDLSQYKDLKELRDFDVKNLRMPRRDDEEESSSAGFIAGLAVGTILGVVLAILFGKQNNGEVMDQFAHRAEVLKGTATEKYHQVRSEVEGQGDSTSAQFGDDVAIEREVNTSDDLLGTSTDTVDSASEDVHSSIDEVNDTADNTVDDVQRRVDRA